MKTLILLLSIFSGSAFAGSNIILKPGESAYIRANDDTKVSCEQDERLCSRGATTCDDLPIGSACIVLTGDFSSKAGVCVQTDVDSDGLRSCSCM